MWQLNWAPTTQFFIPELGDAVTGISRKKPSCPKISKELFKLCMQRNATQQTLQVHIQPLSPFGSRLGTMEISIITTILMWGAYRITTQTNFTEITQQGLDQVESPVALSSFDTGCPESKHSESQSIQLIYLYFTFDGEKGCRSSFLLPFIDQILPSSLNLSSLFSAMLSPPSQRGCAGGSVSNLIPTMTHSWTQSLFQKVDTRWGTRMRSTSVLLRNGKWAEGHKLRLQLYAVTSVGKLKALQLHFFLSRIWGNPRLFRKASALCLHGQSLLYHRFLFWKWTLLWITILTKWSLNHLISPMTSQRIVLVMQQKLKLKP